MSPEKSTKPTKLCPTCGTRVSEDAVRCLVCGTSFAVTEKPSRPGKTPVQGSRMPEITLSLPAALGLLALFLAVGAVLVYFVLRQVPGQSPGESTLTPTITNTPTPSPRPTPVTPTPTDTPLPTPTPQNYTVKLRDTCGGIAYAFNISIQSIVMLNNLPADCSTLYEGQKLLIPAPTSTPTPLPTNTLSPADATEAACAKTQYTVQENDTLSSIATNYQVPMSEIRDYNGMVNDTVRFGQKLTIPLCKRNATPGPSPTPTPPPPYPPANLLLPPDGAPFTLADDTVTLQWASVGTLRENELYAVTVEDVTEGEGRKIVDYVADTKYVIPVNFRPAGNTPHVVRWWVSVVRQTGTDKEGNPLRESAGATSTQRVFTWIGSSAPTPAP